MTEVIKIDGNSIQIGNKVCYCVDKDLIDCITNLQQENEKLKYNARSQVNDYFKDKYVDEVLKKSELVEDFELTCYKNYQLKQENETLNNIMNDFEDWLKNNFWNDDEGNESYQIEKHTTYYSVYRKLDLLKTLYRGDK